MNLVRISDRYLHYFAEIFFLIKSSMLYHDILVNMEIYVTLFLSIHFCKVYSIGAVNVYTNLEINRYTIDEFRKHANIVFLFDVT